MKFILAILTAVILLTSASGAQDEQTKRSELGVRQKLVERKMVELENKLTVIAERIKDKEPDRAQRLVKAYQQSKEKLITKKMSLVSELLDQNRLQEATANLDEVIANIESLIRLLTNEQSKEMSQAEEEAMLEDWKNRIQQQLEEQRAQRDETEKVSHKEKTIDDLEAQIKKLNDLIQQQKKVIDETEENSDAGLRELDKIADKQFDVRQATEKLSKELGGQQESPKPGEMKDPQSGEQKPGDAKPGDAKPGDEKPGDQKPDEQKPGEQKSEEQKPGDSKPGDSKPGDSKPGDSKPGDSKPGDSKPGDSKPGDSKPGDSKPGDSKPGDSKPGDSKPGDSKPGDSKPGDSKPPQPGQESLDKATKHQQTAEEKLGSGKPDDAKAEQEKALDEMDKALSEIEKEKRRIESLPPEALEQMADQQRRTRDKAMDVVKQMEKAPTKKSDDENQSADQQQQQPGQEKMEQAGDSMKQASDDLQNQDPEEAQKNQQQAEQKMEQALDEIEERLNQLREETREEKLARLESRFREMLERQIVASVMTIELDDKRTNLGLLQRRDQLLQLRLANEEREISELAQQAYDLLLEDGTSIVFPEIVQELRTDLEQAAHLLQEERTDRFTQLIQKEVETTIADLLDALAEAKKKDKEGGGGGGGGGGGKQPLLKMSAELKILKLQQLRLNRRTKKVEQMRGPEDLDPLLDQESAKAAELQAKLIEVTEGIMEKE